jgi:hypothetical protein
MQQCGHTGIQAAVPCLELHRRAPQPQPRRRLLLLLLLALQQAGHLEGRLPLQLPAIQL